MALLVKTPVNGRCHCTRGGGFDLGDCVEIIDNESSELIAIIGGIRNEVADALQAGQQRFGLRAVSMMTRRWMDANWQADSINHSMELGGQSST